MTFECACVEKVVGKNAFSLYTHIERKEVCVMAAKEGPSHESQEG